MKIAIIPARGGSKRIPRKNIKQFNGKPMIVWSIEAALQANVFDRIIVSTDDLEIADCAINHGAEVPFIRPEILSNDAVGTHEVIVHALDYCSDINFEVTHACCIYATAPFIQVDDIQQGCIDIASGLWDYVLPITEYSSPIFRAFKELEAAGGLEMFFPESYNKNSQEFEAAFHDAGQFYWGSSNAWRKSFSLFSKKTKGIKVPRWRAMDIDTEQDWEEAELLQKAMELKGI